MIVSVSVGVADELACSNMLFLCGELGGMRINERPATFLRRLIDNHIAMEKALGMIADIGEGSTTANSLPHIAKIARAALATEAA